MSLTKETGSQGRKRREANKAKEDEFLKKVPKLTTIFQKTNPSVQKDQTVEYSLPNSNKNAADDDLNKDSERLSSDNHPNAMAGPSILTEVLDSERIPSSVIEAPVDNFPVASPCVNVIINYADPTTWPKITESFRTTLLKIGPQQDIREKYPKTQDQERRFTKGNFYKKLANNELVKRDWLLYGGSSDSLFCFPCILFPSPSHWKQCRMSDLETHNPGFKDWQHVHEALIRHENTSHHFDSTNAWKIKLSKQKFCVDTQINEQYDNELNFFRKLLRRIVDVILFLSTRNLALRGHHEILGSFHNGNFLGLIELLAKYDSVLNTHLARIKSKGTHLTYFSSDIQNEIVNLLAEKLRQEICQEIATAKYYTIFFDATPDQSKREQFSECFRYVKVDSTGANICEAFFEFFDTTAKTGEAISNAILERLSRIGLSIEDCRGQGYDNASNMAGIYQGVQARILQVNSRAKFLPCAAHSLNLVGKNAADYSLNAKKYFAIIQLSASPPRWELLKSFMAVVPKTLSKTRWSERFDAVKPFMKHYDRVLNLLHFIQNDKSCSYKQDIVPLSKKIQRFDFIFWTCMWFKIVEELEMFNQYLQKNDVFVSNVVRNLQSLIARFIEFRENGFDECYEQATTIALENDISFTFESVRLRKRNRKYFEVETEKQPKSTEEIYKTELTDLLDRILQALEDRFERLNDISNLFSFLEPKNIMVLGPDEAKKCVQDLYVEYSSDFAPSDLVSEIQRFQATAKNYDEKIEESNVVSCLSLIYKNDLVEMFPNLSILLRIYLTLPITTAINERSFSKLNLIETYLRAAIGEDRLSDFAILSIESERTVKINYDEVIDAFATKKLRKVSFKSSIPVSASQSIE